MDTRATEIVKQGDALFNKRQGMLSHWQACAEQFYPTRADFTKQIVMGEDIGSNLMTSVPVIMCRDLANMFSSMLRPRGQPWYEITTSDDSEDIPHEAREWLEEKQKTMRNAMYDPVAGFQRALKETDYDYVAFGQGVVKQEINSREHALLFRSRHLRDVAWSDDFTGRTCKVHEKFSPTACQLAGMFSKSKLHRDVLKALETDPEKEFACRHVVIPKESYETLKDAKKFPKAEFVSIYIDVENGHIIEEAPSVTLKYVIPRWLTVSGSQYAYSQAAIAALPEARGLQQMTQVILDAGENYVRPPLIAVEEALRSNLNVYSAGVTYVSAKYDERTGDPVRPLDLGKGGLNVGFELLDRARMVLREAFFLDKINLPVMQAGVTAFEIQQRTQEFIRNAMPLFDPVESEGSAPMCEMIFKDMMAYGFFGQDIPESLQNESIKFKFKSPLREAEDQALVRAFAEGKAIIADTAQFDPSAVGMMNLRKALRDTLSAAGVPAKWVRDEKEVEDMAAAEDEKREAEQMMAQIGQAGAVAEQGGKGMKAMVEAMPQ